MKRKIIVMCPNKLDATSMYRGMGPLSHLIATEWRDLELVFVDRINWAYLASVDGVFFQRPYKKEHVEMIEMAKSVHIPVWVDYDDDLFQVPISNPAYDVYKGAHDIVAQAIQMANVVTVSTHQLKRNLLPLNSNIHVIPNALNERLFKRPKELPSRQPVMLWRGSATHDKDLLTFMPQLDRLIKSDLRAMWTFIGKVFWLMEEQFGGRNNTVFGQALEITDYFETIGKIAPAGMIVPLHNSMFNFCKSNIAWIEAVFAGGIAIAPEWEEWKLPGCMTYKTPDEFESHCKAVISNGIDVQHESKLGWEYIQDTLTLDVVNRQRVDLLKQLLA